MMGWIAPVSAAAAKRRQEEEEKRLIEALQRDDPAGNYEYKVLRSYGFAFARDDKRQEILWQEARAGWELAQQIDSSRLILRRPRSMREQDNLLSSDYNPYRTQVGTNWPLLVGVLVALLLALMLGMGLIVGGETGSFEMPVVLVAIGIIVVGMVVALKVVMRVRG